MPRKTTKKETLTLNKEELNILHEVLTDYKSMVEYTYRQNAGIIAQGELMLKESTDKNKTLELVKMLEKYKEQTPILDIARLRADSLHLKVKDALGIKDEPDESTNEHGDGAEQNDTSANEQDAEVSEGSEVLHEDK